MLKVSFPELTFSPASGITFTCLHLMIQSYWIAFRETGTCWLFLQEVPSIVWTPDEASVSTPLNSFLSPFISCFCFYWSTFCCMRLPVLPEDNGYLTNVFPFLIVAIYSFLQYLLRLYYWSTFITLCHFILIIILLQLLSFCKQGNKGQSHGCLMVGIELPSRYFWCCFLHITMFFLRNRFFKKLKRTMI